MKPIFNPAYPVARLFMATGIFFLFFFRSDAQPDASFNYNPGRPGFGYGSSPLITHTLSVESFFYVSGRPELPWSQTGYFSNGYTIRYSPVERLEIAVGSGWIKDETYGGISYSGMSVVAKINVVKKGPKAWPGLAFVGGLSLPVGYKSQYAVSKGVNPFLTLIMDQNIGSFWIAYNIGGDWNVPERQTGLFYCITAGTSLDARGRWNLYGEFVGVHDWKYSKESVLREKSENSFLLRLGADVFVTSCFKIDLSVASTLETGNTLEAEIGFSYGIPLKKRTNPKE